MALLLFQRIQYSRSDSDVISKMKGTFVERPKTNLKKTVPGQELDSRRARKKAAKEAAKQQKQALQQGAAPSGSIAPGRPNGLYGSTLTH